MAKRRRRMFSAAESAEVWDRWQRSEGLKLIGWVLDRPARQPYRHDLDPRTSRIGRGSCAAKALGRRPLMRLGQHLHRDFGRAAHTLCASRRSR
jgi:hypothetical protein